MEVCEYIIIVYARIFFMLFAVGNLNIQNNKIKLNNYLFKNFTIRKTTCFNAKMIFF